MALSDWESDLTELSSSSDEEYVEKVQPKKRGPGRPLGSVKEYKINNSLRPPRSTNYSIRSLYDWLVSGHIDLDPQYQREVVWPETKQAALIDSMLRNYYIPPVIFANKWNKRNEHNPSRVCIDGKQRLTSIRRFIDGEIAHRDSETGKKYWYSSAPGAKRPVLSKQLKQSFLMAQIVCVEYDEISEEQEREIFQRVQMGVALTPAERMQAISGPWPDLIREIQSVIIGEEGFSDALEWGTSRGRDFQCLAMIVYMLQGHQTFPGASVIEKWLSNSDPVPAKLRTDILETFKIFVHLAREKKYTICFQKPSRISPVEFVMTGVGIHTLRNRLSFTQLASAIAKMREDVRVKHVDIRANKRVVQTMQAFLKKVPMSALKSDPLDRKPAAVALKAIIRDNQSSKRKRDEETEEEEERRPAPSKIAKTAKVAKKGKAEAQLTSKAPVTKAASKASTVGSKTIVKKVSTAVSKKAAAPSTSGSAKEPPANKPTAPNLSRPAQPHVSASTSATPPPPPPSSSVSTSSYPDPPTRSQAPLAQQTTTALSHHSSEETIIPGSLSRRREAPRSAEQNAPPPEAATAIVQAVVVKPDPDAPSISGVLDRLAIIRKAKLSPDRSVPSNSIPTPTQPTSFAAQQIQGAQQATSISTPPTAVQSSTVPQSAVSHQRVSPLPRVATEAAIPANTTSSPSSMQITAAQVQSILARAGLPSHQQPERRSTVDVVPGSSSGADTGTRDPRRRPSASPNQTFHTPGFVSGTNAAAAGSPPPPPSTPGANVQPTNGNAASSRQSPPVASPAPLSPTLPKKPETRPPPANASTSDTLAEQISPLRRSPDIPRAPRPDRERELNGSGTPQGVKRTRWDQPQSTPGGWRVSTGGGAGSL